MKKLLIVLALSVAALAQGGTTSSDINPATTGQKLGRPNARWSINAQDIDIRGNITCNGVPCSSNSDPNAVKVTGDQSVAGVKTFTNIVVIKKSNNIPKCETYTGTDAFAQMNACMADASAGIADARGFGGSYTVTTPLAIPAGVRLLMNNKAKFTVSVTGGVDAITGAEGAVLDCGPNQAVTQDVGFVLGASANVKSLLANADQTGHQNYFFVNGGVVRGNASATVADSLVRFQGVFLGSGMRDTVILSPYNTIGLHVLPGTGAGGGLKIISDLVFDNVQVNGGNVTGARPCVIETAAASQTSNISFLAGGCQHAGSGKYEIEVNGGTNTAAGLASVFFYGHHAETSTGSLGVKIADAQNVFLDGVSFSGTGTGAALVNISETVAGATQNVRVTSAFNSTSFTSFVANAIDSSTVPIAFTLGEYSYKSPSFHQSRTITGSGNYIGAQLFTAGTDALKPLTLQWFSATQSADFLDCLNNVGTVLCSIDKSGNVTAGGGFFKGSSLAQMQLGSGGAVFTINGAAAKIAVGSIEVNNAFGTAPPANGIYAKGQIKTDGGFAVGASAGVDKTCAGSPTALTLTKGIITAITCP